MPRFLRDRKLHVFAEKRTFRPSRRESACEKDFPSHLVCNIFALSATRIVERARCVSICPCQIIKDSRCPSIHKCSLPLSFPFGQKPSKGPAVLSAWRENAGTELSVAKTGPQNRSCKASEKAAAGPDLQLTKERKARQNTQTRQTKEEEKKQARRLMSPR